ncbi:MAG: hypothetical protein GXY83_44045, partial [Rhodopirellula sp.]|nr:hypothetical protein [Rhodopirellula sp.]
DDYGKQEAHANKQDIGSELVAKRTSFRAHALKAKILLSDDFNTAVDRFAETLSCFEGEPRAGSVCAERFMKHKKDLPSLYEELLNAARRGLGVEQLSAASREAIKTAVGEALEKSSK